MSIDAKRRARVRAVDHGLLALGALLTAFGVSGNPMLLVFPMWIFTYELREPLRRVGTRLPLDLSFLGFGVLFGMLTEVFAIVNNLSRPPDQRVLLSPDPARDFVYGLFYYTFVIGTWDLLLRRYRYSKIEVFLITGALGIFTEEVGRVFVGIFTVPVTGFLYAIIVAFVYGIFPMLTCLVNEGRFSPQYESNWPKRLVVASAALFIQWAVYGNVVLPLLKRVY